MNILKQLPILMVALGALALAGCNDTAAGMAEDTSENAAAVEEAADEAAENAKEAADDVVEAGEDAVASHLTAQIKSAYIANPILNEDNVRINVESDAEQVILKGSVATEEQHEMALEIAKKVIEEDGDGQNLVDELTMES